MKIYFAGSIRGGRDDKEMYSRLIQHLGKYGQVLTEHIGDQNLNDFGETDSSDEYIYKRDRTWIQESDVVVADVSAPSLGVGYEIGKAEEFDKKILCLYKNQQGKRLSAMIGGNSNLEIVKYETAEDAIGYIDDFLKKLESK